MYLEHSKNFVVDTGAPYLGTTPSEEQTRRQVVLLAKYCNHFFSPSRKAPSTLSTRYGTWKIHREPQRSTCGSDNSQTPCYCHLLIHVHR